MTMTDNGYKRKINSTVCAAVYRSVVNMSREDAERVIAAQLHEIYTFADQNDIVIVESYIERDDSLSELNRLLENCGRYRVILHCGGIGSEIQEHALDIINVTTRRFLRAGISVIGE